GHGMRNRRQQHLRQSRVATALRGNFRVDAAKGPRSAAGGRLQDGEAQVLALAAKLHGLFTPHLRKVIHVLRRQARLDGWQVFVAAQSVQTGDENGPEAAIRGHLWNSLNAKLTRNIAQVVAEWLNARGGDAIDADAGFIYEKRRERVCFAQGNVPRFCGLVAGGKGTAVGDSGEWSRDELGRVGVTDTDKHLILGADDLIAAHVKLVGVDAQAGITREIGEQAGVVRCGKQIQQGDGVGIEAGCRNEISREGFADKPRLCSSRSSGGTRGTRPARRCESRDWIDRTTENGARG